MDDSQHESDYAQWGKDESILQEIGKYFGRESHPVRVRKSRVLADEAISAWQRDETRNHLEIEPVGQRRIRHAARTLALIGMTLENGVKEIGAEVVFELDARYVGSALEAADSAAASETE